MEMCIRDRDNAGAELLWENTGGDKRQYIRVTGKATEPQTVQLTVTALNYTDSNGSTVNLGQEVATYTCTVGAPVSKADELPTLLTSGKDKANVYIRLKGTGTASVITVSDLSLIHI